MIFLYCHQEFLENENIKYDFIINTRSFMEMNKKQFTIISVLYKIKLMLMDIF